MNGKSRMVLLSERMFNEVCEENERWFAWSGGRYPDEAPGDVIAAEADGTITLDDGITTWNPLRACAFLKARVPTSIRAKLDGE